MTRGKAISQQIRGRAIKAILENQSQAQVARRFSLTKLIVRDIYARFLARGSTKS